MSKQILVTASLLGALAVVLGAFGAHALKGLVGEAQQETWSTAVQYHFVHTLALLYLAKFGNRSALIRWAFRCFAFGIALFSGSLYLLSTRSVNGLEFVNFLGPVTPIGGLFFIGGWILLLIASLKMSGDA